MSEAKSKSQLPVKVTTTLQFFNYKNINMEEQFYYGVSTWGPN